MRRALSLSLPLPSSLSAVVCTPWNRPSLVMIGNTMTGACFENSARPSGRMLVIVLVSDAGKSRAVGGHLSMPRDWKYARG